MAKNKVDGVYSADPRNNPDARRYSRLSHQEAIERNLKVMDTAALSLCRENNLPILVFDMAQPTSITQALLGQVDGTLVTAGQSVFS